MHSESRLEGVAGAEGCKREIADSQGLTLLVRALRFNSAPAVLCATNAMQNISAGDGAFLSCLEPLC